MTVSRRDMLSATILGAAALVSGVAQAKQKNTPQTNEG